jgi:hypothetical protein
MITARQVLEQKGTQVWTIGPDAAVFDAIAMMAGRRSQSLELRGELPTELSTYESWFLEITVDANA